MSQYLPSFGTLALFALLVAYEYIRDLRRRLSNTEDELATVWRLYENKSNELRDAQGLPPYKESIFTEAKKPKARSGFNPAGIGPTAINAREMIREREEDLNAADPPFAGPETLGVTSHQRHTPSPSDIAAAAREATRNGNSR